MVRVTNMRPYLILSLFLLPLFIPFVADAQGGFVNCTGNGCQACNVTTLVYDLTSWLIGIGATIAGLLIVYSGFLLVTSGGNPGAASRAKSIMTGAVIGLIIAGTSWLVVDVMLKTLTKRGGLNNWKVQCVQQPSLNDGVNSVRSGVAGPGAGPGSEVVGVVDTNEKLTDADAKAALAAAGVEVKSGASLEGVTGIAVNEIIRLKRACGCDIVVTEGTGGTHADGTFSHANGYKIDLRSTNPELNSHIESYTYIGERSDGAAMYQNGCTTYARESNHWDVQVKPSC